MLVELLKGLWFLLFRARLQKSFNGLLVAATWLLALALLSVSVPHTVEIITLYERGEWAAREAKAIAMSLVLEIIPALTLLTALHNATLTLKQRQILAGLSFPFVLLTLHIQFSYYAGPTGWPIYPLELALPLPYGVLVCSAIIAFVWPKMEQHPIEAETDVAAQFAEMREGLREVAGAIRVVQSETSLNPNPLLQTQTVRISEPFAPNPNGTGIQTPNPNGTGIQTPNPNGTGIQTPNPSLLSEPKLQMVRTSKPAVMDTLVNGGLLSEPFAPNPNLSSEPKPQMVRASQQVWMDGAADSGSLPEPFAPNPQLVAQPKLGVSLTALLGEELLVGEDLALSKPQSEPSTSIQTPTLPDLKGLEGEEREAQCYRLRMDGWSYPAIGKLFDPAKSETTARKYVQTYAKRYGLDLK